ncbi:MAG: hypothetical protein A4E51_01036 [Methanosaeta sp. PtaU1.Bin055]|nr:MAG: hypothetical protein A4E51_01036 [Methanosaeta sp. PtaU1.Bin055]
MIWSLLKNPVVRGNPARVREPASIVRPVHFMCFRTPPISLMSLVPTAWMTLPAQRKRRALKKEWPIRWKIETPTAVAPTAAPNPRAAIMYPSWLTVE